MACHEGDQPRIGLDGQQGVGADLGMAAVAPPGLLEASREAKRRLGIRGPKVHHDPFPCHVGGRGLAQVVQQGGLHQEPLGLGFDVEQALGHLDGVHAVAAVHPLVQGQQLAVQVGGGESVVGHGQGRHEGAQGAKAEAGYASHTVHPRESTADPGPYHGGVQRSIRVLLTVLCLLAIAMAGAQEVPPQDPAVAPADVGILFLDERGWPVGLVPEEVADAAVQSWVDRPQLAIAELAGRPAAELCAALPALVTAPPAGTRVVIEDRRETAQEDEGRRVFTYAAARPGDVLDVAQVDLVQDEEGRWTVQRVGFRPVPDSGIRAWLQTPTASYLMIGLSLAVLLSLFFPSPLRRGLALGLATARRYRGTVLFTMGLLYGVFLLGVVSGASLPDECEAAVLEVVTAAVSQVGATAAYGSGDLPRAAAVTFYQNFLVVTFGLHFLLSLFFGLPSYLVAVPQFLLLGVPFGMLQGTPFLDLLPVLLVIVLELTAYFLMISGGGIVLGTLIRRGFAAYPQALREVASLLVPAGLLLLLGAWYEAYLLLVVGI